MRYRQWKFTTAWRVPLLYALFALTAGTVLPRIERAYLPGLSSAVSVSAAMAMYSSIASGMIALTGIVFSLTFVMVQFSATAYSPRVVLWLARDPLISHALGIFMATFLYAVAALAWVDRGGASVPFVSAIMVIVLLLASVGFFVALIHRVALLQVHRLLGFMASQGREVIDDVYPPLDAETAILPRDEPLPAPSQICSHQGRPLIVQTVRAGELVQLAARYGVLLEVVAAVGDTVVESMPLVYVRGSSERIDEELLTDPIELGEERTFDQDPKYAIRLLADIAIKALSPAVNDPTTAVQALDQIGDLLLRLSWRRLEIGAFRDDRGVLRLLIPFPSWDDFLWLAFDEIRCYGATSIQVMRRMNALISDLLRAVPVERRDALRQWHERLASSIGRHFDDPDERKEARREDRQGIGSPRQRPAA